MQKIRRAKPTTSSTVYPRKGTKYWWADYTDAWGAFRRESTKCTDEGSARAWLAIKEVERLQILAGGKTARPVTLGDAIVEWMVEYETGVGESWFITVRGFMRHQVLPHFGAETVVSAIGAAHVVTFQSKQRGRMNRNCTKTPRPVMPATVNRTLAALASFGTWCCLDGRNYLTENVFSEYKADHEAERSLPEADILQLDAFVEAIDVVRVKEAIIFMLDTGARQGEVEKLALASISADNSTATFLKTKDADKLRPSAMTSRCKTIVENARKSPRPDGLLFGELGNVRRVFARAAKKAGMGHVWPHALRHFWATHFVAAGATLPETMAAGGWATPRMVKRYAHASVKAMATASSRMEAMRDQLRKDAVQPHHSVTEGSNPA